MGGGELLTQDYQLNISLTLFFSGPDERIRILKFAFELLQIETQCARAILRQEPDLVIIFRPERPQLTQLGKMEVWQGWALAPSCPARQYIKKSTFSVDAAGKDGSLAGLGSSALMPCQAIYKKKYLLCRRSWERWKSGRAGL